MNTNQIEKVGSEKKKACKNCGKYIDVPDERRSSLFDDDMGIKVAAIHIYNAILDGKFRSIDLCNLCYSLMQAYRHTLSKEEREQKEGKLL